MAPVANNNLFYISSEHDHGIEEKEVEETSRKSII